MIAKRFKRRRVKCNLAYLQLYLIDLISFVEILNGLALIFCLKTTASYFLLPWDYSKKYLRPSCRYLHNSPISCANLMPKFTKKFRN